MAERYNFKYLPLVGKLPGKSMVEQTETAINELASVVYDNVGYVGNLAEEVQTANTNASNALEKATEALETSSRVYIKQIAAVDVNDYYDSELYYINNDGSTNIPVRDRGFLEVKTNDDKTACEQVFIADSTGTPYYRHGRITEQTLGEETTYVVTWSSWYRGATTEYVQAELQDYLPLSGGTVTGGLTVEGGITGNLNGNANTATNATNDANGNPIAGTYLPLAGGTMTGAIKWSGNDLNVIKRDSGNDGICIIGGDTDNFSGATLQLFGQTHSSYAGRFYLRASTKSGVNDTSHPSVNLIGSPDGSLTWNGKEIERVNSSGSNYIRYESGIQIVFDGINVSGASSYVKTYTYPVAFKKDLNVYIAITGRWASSNEQASIQNDNNTKFEVNITNAGSNSHNWLFIAIGWWK